MTTADPRSWSRPLVAGSLALLSVIWGSQFLVIRMGLETVPPLLAACLRFAVFTAVTQTVVLATGASAPRGLSGAWRACFGVAQTAAMALLYISERYVASSIAAVVFATAPFFVALFAHALVPGERLNARLLLATIFGFLGVATILVADTTARLTVLGALAALGGACAAALNKIAGKRLADQAAAAVLLRDMALVVTLGTGFAWWLFERHEPIEWTASAVGTAVYLGLVASAGASTLYLLLLRRIPVTAMAYLQFATALVAVLTGVSIGRETLALRHAIGAALILAGLAVLAVRRTRIETEWI